MNYYVGVINDVVDYIEYNMNEKLSLTALSQQFGISDFHFNRMFKTVAGITMKQYILGRKLTTAMGSLRKTNRPVIDIALDLGFEYPEVFSRAFKKQFGVSPAEFRDNYIMIEGVPKAIIIERDIINYRGVLALKGKSKLLNEFLLTGVSTDVDVSSGDFKTKLESQTNNFISGSAKTSSIDDLLYTLVNCHGEDNGEYTVFCGKKLIAGENEHGYEKRVVPGGWYVCFEYYGNMFEIRESFNDDLYRWIMVNEAEIELNGIGMMDIFNNDYPKNDRVEILIPVKKPV